MQSIITSILAFSSTNIDDIFVLMLFFGSKRFKPIDIFVGQYVGIVTLVIVSLAGAYLGGFIDPRYVGLLGFFPIYLGIKQAVGLFRKSEDKDDLDIETKSTSIFSVAAV